MRLDNAGRVNLRLIIYSIPSISKHPSTTTSVASCKCLLNILSKVVDLSVFDEVPTKEKLDELYERYIKILKGEVESSTTVDPVQNDESKTDL